MNGISDRIIDRLATSSTRSESVPVCWKAQVAKRGGRVHTLVRQVVDGHHAACILVDTVAAVLACHIGRHQARMPIVCHKDDVLAVREPRWLAAPAFAFRL